MTVLAPADTWQAPSTGVAVLAFLAVLAVLCAAAFALFCVGMAEEIRYQRERRRLIRDIRSFQRGPRP